MPMAGNRHCVPLDRLTLTKAWFRSLVGTWKLVHATARDAAGAARPSPYGGKALGCVTFTADGRSDVGGV